MVLKSARIEQLLTVNIADFHFTSHQPHSRVSTVAAQGTVIGTHRSGTGVVIPRQMY